jgi:ABC-2 type transport system ATP-binding protein
MKRQVGYVSPELDFRPWGRIGRAIDFVRGFYPSWDEAYCDHLLASLGLNRADKVGTLSFGAKIKLAIVLALSWRPRLLVLDEPTVGLDAIARQQVFAELLAAVHDENRAVFISSHAIADLERIADHVGMIKNGRLVFEGATDEVVDRYRLVDLVADAITDLNHQPGVVVQQHEQDRWRVIIDRSVTSVERLTGRGARAVADTPMSLEELFVALGR